MGRPRLVQALLLVLATLLYANTVPNRWALDDTLIITNNRYVQRGLAGADSLLLKDAFYGSYGSNVHAVAGGRWRPLSPLLFAAEAELLAPLKKNAAQEVVRDAAGFRQRDLGADTWFPHLLHLQNALLFGLVCAVLYGVLRRLLHERVDGAAPARYRPDVVALAATVLYAVHPLHTEVVANVKSCDELLSLLVALLTLHLVWNAYHAGAGLGPAGGPAPGRWLAAAAGTFALALLAKETAVGFVVVIPLALWFFTPAAGRRIAALCWPLLLVLGLYGAARTAVVGRPGAAPVAEELMNDPFLVLDARAQYAPLVPGSDVQKLLHPNADTFTKMPYANELATNLYTYGRYLKLLVWPHPLTSDYYPRTIAVQSFADPSVWAGLLLNAGLLGWALWQLRGRRSALAFAILVYYATFALVSNLLFPIGTNMAERFLFVPSVGFCLAGALGLDWVLRRAGARAAGGTLVGFGLACAVLAAATVGRNAQWQDNLTLLTHDAQVSVGSGKVKTDLAGTLLAGLAAQNQPGLPPAAAPATTQVARDSVARQALPLLREALRIHPMSWSAWLHLGSAHLLLAQNPANLPQVNYTHLLTSLAALDQAHFYQSAHAEASINALRSLAYADLGRLVGQQYADLPHAAAYLAQAVALDSTNAQAYSLLGTAYAQQRQFGPAIQATERSLALRPHDRGTRENLAVVYQQQAEADPAQRPQLARAELLLREVQAQNRRLPETDPTRPAAIARTLHLLARTYALQCNRTRQAEVERELAALPAARP